MNRLERWKYFILGCLIPSSVIIFVVLLGALDVDIFDIHFHKNKDYIPKANISSPLGEGGLLVIAVAIDDIADSVSKTVQKDNPELPPIELWDLRSSYKTSNRWMAVSDNLIIIFLHADVSSILTKKELEAAVLHEVGHVKLKHVGRIHYTRITQEEIDADTFAVKSGAEIGALISAINKLSPDNDEKVARLTALEHLSE